MSPLLLVQMPPDIIRQIQLTVGGACEEAATLGDVERRLTDRVPDLDALVIGARRDETLKLVEHAARSDPDLGVVLLCEPEERSELDAQLRFSPHPGRDVRCVSRVAQELLLDTVRDTAEQTRRRRRHRAMLAAVEPATRPEPGFSVSPALLLDHLLDHAPIGVFALDAQRRVVAWNRGASDILHRAERDALGSPLRDLVQRSLYSQLGELVARVPAEQTIAGAVVIERPKAAGGRQHLEVWVSSLADPRGEPVFLCTLVDVSERARAEARLVESEARYRSLVETAASVILCVDPRRRILEWNPAAERLFGRKRAEALGRDCLELVPEEFWQVVSDDLLAVLSGTPTKGLEIPVRSHDGATRFFAWNVTRRLDTNGRASSVVAIGHDITERILNERLLEEQTRELERTNRELDEFTTVASHDLQEPLRKLVSFSALLPDDIGSDLPPDAERDLRFIADGAERMQKLVQDLLTLSRTGRSEMQRERVSVDHCADQALEALDLVVRETGAKIEREPLPEVLADPTLLTEIYQNLIGNALKFVARGGPVVRLTVTGGEGSRVFGVRDNGIGVAPEDAVEIFKPFRKLHPSSQYPGSGIGLTICRKAVERHGGRIWAEPGEAGGTHVRFTLGEPPGYGARGSA